jgi:hypothetical protein
MIAALRWFRASSLGRRSIALDSPLQVIGWWEARRIPFNLAVGGAGVCSLAAMAGTVVAARALEIPLHLHEWVLLMVAIEVVVYGIAANLCYTGGWLVELLVRRAWPEHAEHFGELTFTLGFVFSILVTLLPAPLFVLRLALIPLLGELPAPD